MRWCPVHLKRRVRPRALRSAARSAKPFFKPTPYPLTYPPGGGSGPNGGSGDSGGGGGGGGGDSGSGVCNTDARARDLLCCWFPSLTHLRRDGMNAGQPRIAPELAAILLSAGRKVDSFPSDFMGALLAGKVGPAGWAMRGDGRLGSSTDWRAVNHAAGS